MTDTQQPAPMGPKPGGDRGDDPIGVAEALDEMLSRIADDTGHADLDNARRMLHGVIVALETTQRDRDRLATKSQIFRDRADGICGTARVVGETLARIAELEVANGSPRDAWHGVVHQSRILRTIAGTARPTETASARARIAEALRRHEPPTHIDPDGLPADEFDCCVDAVMAVVQPWIGTERGGYAALAAAQDHEDEEFRDFARRRAQAREAGEPPPGTVWRDVDGTEYDLTARWLDCVGDDWVWDRTWTIDRTPVMRRPGAAYTRCLQLIINEYGPLQRADKER